MQTHVERGSIITDMRSASDQHHPVHAAERKAVKLRKLVDEGESPVALAVILGTIVSVIGPLVAFVIFLAFAAAHYS
jgi:hypothetical protein